MGKKKIVTLIMVIAVGCIGVHACFLDAAAQAKNRVFSENEERIVKASYPDVSAAEPEEQPQELSAVEPSQVMAKDMADKEAEEDGETDADEKEDRIYSVTFPAEIHAYLDPGNISGRGQIFSDVYTIENYSNRDVAVKIKNIVYIETIKRNVIVHMGNDAVTCDAAISEMERALADEGFYRVHRSFLINLRCVESFCKTDIKMNNGDMVMLSTRKFTEFKKRLMEYRYYLANG